MKKSRSLFYLCIFLLYSFAQPVKAQYFEDKIRLEQQRFDAIQNGFLEAAVIRVDSTWKLIKGDVYHISSIVFSDSLISRELTLIKGKYLGK
ncbi:hypothetical protein EP331_07640, partial [bacterium]